MFYVSSVPEEEEISTQSVSANQPSSNNYPEEYKSELEILKRNDEDFLRCYILSGNINSSRIRSIYWRILLRVLPTNSLEWPDCIRALRTKYEEIKKSFNLDPHRTTCEPDDNPLSQNANSVWFRYFCDEELKKVISQDVTRTFPEKQFFQSSRIQHILSNVLFVYARKNPAICYRQGMNEILAINLYVIHEDCLNFDKLNVDNEILRHILNLEFLEHDVYYLFSSLMSHMLEYYKSDSNITPDSCGHFPAYGVNTKNTDLDHENSIPNYGGISLHVNLIMKTILAVHDPPLHHHMERMNIPFIAFGIRWLRLLFGREFQFSDLFILWDTIFAHDADFSLVDYIFVAMLITIRDKLLNHDYVDCLTILMKFPPNMDVMFIAKLALHLKEPSIFRKPSSSYLSKCSTSDQCGKMVHNPEEILHGNLQKKKYFHLNLYKSSRSKKNRIVQQPILKSYDALSSEVKHLRVVMSLCKLKLLQYHDTLSTSISLEDSAVQSALTGIKELCDLLEIDQFSMPLQNATAETPVEQAREAGEIPCSLLSTSEKDVVSEFLPPPKTEVNMTTFREPVYTVYNESEFPSKFPHIISPKNDSTKRSSL